MTFCFPKPHALLCTGHLVMLRSANYIAREWRVTLLAKKILEVAHSSKPLDILTLCCPGPCLWCINVSREHEDEISRMLTDRVWQGHCSTPHPKAWPPRYENKTKLVWKSWSRIPKAQTSRLQMLHHLVPFLVRHLEFSASVSPRSLFVLWKCERGQQWLQIASHLLFGKDLTSGSSGLEMKKLPL